MPKVNLTQLFVSNPPKVEGKAKINYFDTELPGFMLEVRATGKSTFYQRFRDKYGSIKQFRIGPTDAVNLEDARVIAKKLRSKITMGLDPDEETERNRNMPVLVHRELE